MKTNYYNYLYKILIILMICMCIWYVNTPSDFLIDVILALFFTSGLVGIFSDNNDNKLKHTPKQSKKIDEYIFEAMIFTTLASIIYYIFYPSDTVLIISIILAVGTSSYGFHKKI